MGFQIQHPEKAREILDRSLSNFSAPRRDLLRTRREDGGFVAHLGLDHSVVESLSSSTPSFWAQVKLDDRKLVAPRSTLEEDLFRLFDVIAGRPVRKDLGVTRRI